MFGHTIRVDKCKVFFRNEFFRFEELVNLFFGFHIRINSSIVGAKIMRIFSIVSNWHQKNAKHSENEIEKFEVGENLRFCILKFYKCQRFDIRCFDGVGDR